MSTARILHVLTTIRRGGAENHVVELITHQRAQGLAVAVAYLVGEGYWRQRLEALGVAVHDLRLKAYGDPMPVLRLRRLLNQFQPTLVHAHLPPAELYARLALLGRKEPLLITKHNDEPFHKRALARPLGRWVARRASRVIAISDAVRRYMTDIDLHLPAEQVTTIRYSLNPTPFLAADGEKVRRELKIPAAAYVIGVVARFERQKSLETLITGFTQLPDKNARLVIVGHGPLEVELRKLADDRVIWAGFREDIPAVMAAFDVFALSSIYEGFGLVLLEAMAAGKPVVATQVSAIPEIVVPGETGILVPPREPAAFTAAFEQLKDQALRARLGANGRQRVITEFSQATMFDRTDAVYAATSAVGSHGNSPHPDPLPASGERGSALLSPVGGGEDQGSCGKLPPLPTLLSPVGGGEDQGEGAGSVATGKARLVYLTTAGITARSFLDGQLRYLQARGFDITVVSMPGDDLDEVARREKVRTVGVPMQREISPLADVVSLWRLYRLMRRLRPDIVNAGTPKAGLLGTMAAWLAQVPVRIYSLHGLQLETARGLKRRVLGATERLSSLLAHQVICVSPSLRRRYVELGLAAESKTMVLGSGSANGVNATRFAPAAKVTKYGELVIGFIGRFTRDKGIEELVAAFDKVSAELPQVRLLLVGDFEDGDPVSAACVQRLKNDARVTLTGNIPGSEVPGYYHAMDVIAFPTYREGFPNVPLEAAASGVPVVGFRATGVVDAIVDGVTGAIVPLGDVNALAGALARYLRDADLRRAHGAAARERVLREFRQEPLWEAMRANYAALLRKPAGANGPVVFIIPIKSAKMSKDWKLTSQLFERCLRSICRQTAPEFRVVVVCNERPVTEFTHPNVHYVAVDFPPPLADTGERTTGYEFGTSEKIKRQNADKARRIRTGYEYAERFHPTHSMVVDADDCVSRRLVEHVLRQPADRGWIFRKGYLYPEGGRLLYYNVRNFNQICGSSVIVPFAHRDTLVQNPDFYDHSLDVLPPAANLTPLPFVGAVYSIANGDNIYMSAETKGSIGRSLFRRIFSKDILALVKKILKYRPALLTPGTRAEFGLYKLA